MSASSTGRPKRPQSSSRKSARSGGRPNRSQLRAAEARSVVHVQPGGTAAVPAPAQAGVRTRRPVSRIFSLSRDAELTYIRHDLRRLIYIGGILLLLMMALLFVLD